MQPYHDDVRRVHEHYHATLKFIYGRPTGRIDDYARTYERCDICTKETKMIILGYYICTRCRRDSESVYKHDDITPLTTRMQTPQHNHLLRLRDQARHAIAMITHCMPPMLYKHASNSRCTACLSTYCNEYLGASQSWSLCEGCFINIAAEVIEIRLRNMLVRDIMHMNLVADVAEYAINIYMFAKIASIDV